jgi:hypothetical protein
VVVLKTSQIAVLKTNQIAALTSVQAPVLTTTQLGILTTAQIAALEPDDLAALKTSQIAGLTTVQTAGLTTVQIPALTTAQAIALTTSQIAALKTSQIAALETRDLAVLKTSQIVAWSTTQLMALTTTQVAALTTAQTAALTAAGRTLIADKWTPIVLDLNGNGIETLGIDAGVQFALEPGQAPVATGWVAPTDGLLVRDLNGDGVINDGGELFGSSTVLPDGTKASDGYAALQPLDANSDGVINSTDAGWGSLKVWTDANSDGVSQAGELASLDSLGVAQLNLNAQPTDINQNGNWVGLVSSFQTVDGAAHDMVDVWFDLRTQVTGMVQAMASFDSVATGVSSEVGSLSFDSTTSSGTVSLAVAVSEMAGVLQQFNQDGNLLATGTASSVLTSTSITAPGQTPEAQILAIKP